MTAPDIELELLRERRSERWLLLREVAIALAIAGAAVAHAVGWP